MRFSVLADDGPDDLFTLGYEMCEDVVLADPLLDEGIDELVSQFSVFSHILLLLIGIERTGVVGLPVGHQHHVGGELDVHHNVQLIPTRPVKEIVQLARGRVGEIHKQCIFKIASYGIFHIFIDGTM